MSNRRFDLGSNDRQLTGAILIGVGVLALLGITGLFNFIGGLVGALLFGALAYYAYTQGERRNNLTWRLAAYPLAGLALASILPGALGGATFLASLGLAFAMYWKVDQRRWWAMIPAGVFASLAAVAFLESFLGASAGWIFLLGLAATFFALTRLRVEPQSWAIWPAGALAVISLMSLTTSGGWIVPVLLIGVGGWLLVRSGVIDLGGPPRTVHHSEDEVLPEVRPVAPPAESPAGATAAPHQRSYDRSSGKVSDQSSDQSSDRFSDRVDDHSGDHPGYQSTDHYRDEPRD